MQPGWWSVTERRNSGTPGHALPGSTSLSGKLRTLFQTELWSQSWERHGWEGGFQIEGLAYGLILELRRSPYFF